jgi:hypothetical protein
MVKIKMLNTNNCGLKTANYDTATITAVQSFVAQTLGDLKGQGIPTERDGSVQLTSSLRLLVS